MPLYDRALRFWAVVELRIRSRLNALLVRELCVDFGVVPLDREWARGISYIIHPMDDTWMTKKDDKGSGLMSSIQRERQRAE